MALANVSSRYTEIISFVQYREICLPCEHVAVSSYTESESIRSIEQSYVYAEFDFIWLRDPSFRTKTRCDDAFRVRRLACEDICNASQLHTGKP